MKTYKQRYKEMNEYYLQRMRRLQDQLHIEKIARQQLEGMYEGYIAQLIEKYGIHKGEEAYAYVDTAFPVLEYSIRVEQTKDRRVRLLVIHGIEEEENIEEGTEETEG